MTLEQPLSLGNLSAGAIQDAGIGHRTHSAPESSIQGQLVAKNAPNPIR